MAYFPNGSSGDRYQAEYCENCWNWHDLNGGRGLGCPIWDFHLMDCYPAYGKDNDDNQAVRKILEHFIPSDKELNPKLCSMFLPKNDVDIKGQGSLFQ